MQDFSVNIGQRIPRHTVIRTQRERKKTTTFPTIAVIHLKKKKYGRAKGLQNTQLEGKYIAGNFAPAY